MASTSDGRRSAAEIEFSSMKQPPLIKQLKGILSEYPDGGQILKEVIQNAEDAEANEVQIVYNGRRINDTTGETTPAYNRFFKGPSLCIYNDAVFTEKDWDGIRMIYSSVKEDDPLTVGRFGLGFKSVFHVTDYPCVISGGKMLLIDPQQSSDKVNAMVNLDEIDQLEHRGLHAESFWLALDGMFGINRECAQRGYFKGTIFWFPLREKKSEISETLYDEAKILDLFEGFQTEASSILLFLKHLQRVSVSSIGADNQLKEITKAEVDDSTGKLKQSRAKFKEKIKLLSNDYKGEDITVDLHMTIRTTINGICECAQWQVVNYFVGNSASSDFKRLIQDEDLGYSPYIGVASPLNEQKGRFEGHVFCFLPLPREGTRLTGLPVHVNGFFALSQNRHHLKWETDEQKGKKIDDKNILWNKYLIKEALPKAYSRLVQCVVDVSNSLGNTDDSIAAVYKCLPLASSIENKWKVLETELYKKIKKLRVLYSKHKSKWVTLADASFASFDNLPEDHKHVKNAVIRCLSLIGKLHIEMPFEVLQNLQKHFQAIKDLTPDALAKQLRQNAAYKNLSNADKLEALTYMCSDGRYYQKVEGLELLPLANGGWTSFRTQGEPVYACTDEEVEILNGLEKRMIMKPSSLGTPLSCHMDQICSNGVFQVKKLTALDLGQLLEITITNQLGANPRITQSSKLSFAWLQNTWKYIIESNVVPYMKNVPLVPVLTAGTWDSPESADLIFVSDMILVKSSDKEELAQGLCRCFENMGVKVVGALPKWIPRENIKSFFHWPSKKSIIALLTKLGTMENANETTEMFNTRTKWKDKSVLAACLAKCHTNLTEEAIDFTKTLKIFHAITSMEDAGTDTALSETNVYVNDEEQFLEGVRFPSRYISTESSKEGLLSTLGARKIELEELVIATLNGFQKEGHKNVNEIPKFMDYFINKFHLFQTNDTIINAASNIPFLRAGNQRCKASDLFDPSDSNLQDLLIGDALLPETKKRLSNEKVRILKFLGLKGADKITADIILQVAKTLDAWSRDSHNHTQCVKKANSLLNCLHFRESLLDEKCKNGLTLSKCLTSLSCIPVQNSRVPPYPDCVQWFSEDIHLCKPSEAKETCMSLLIGATKPIVACTSDKINTGFGWKLPPAVTDVILQLESVSKSYSVQNRPDIMPMIKAIYGHLSQRHREIWQKKQTFARAKLIWNGTGFVTVNEVITLKQSDNLDLYPYFCFVPAEFQSMERLFTSFGCRLEQNIQVLIETLQQIRKVHSTSQEAHTVVRDRNIVCNILDRIALNYKQHLTAIESEILMMVHDRNPNCLRLFPLSECTYDDDPTCYFEDDENVHLVHEMVSPNTVEALGVKSITRKALMEAEELGVEEWGQQEPLTTRIHALLRDGYTDGLSVPKELIQNADDAGASVVKFLYDERQNNDVKQRVFSKGMRSFQGPALWIFNDARFSADDMKNITKLNAATKQADIRKIGKFGLGFCSVYNLTDLPSFLSGSNLVFFDPHEKHLGNVLRSRGTGLRYQLPNKTLVSRHVDQFKPYSGIFGCNIEQDDFKEYDGTLFRLPLRTEQQARESRISSVSYTNDEMVTLLRMFIKAAGNFLLFTQNVRKIEIYHLCESATTASEQRLLHIIERNSVKWDQGVTGPANANVLARMPEMLQTNCEFQEIHKSVICQTLTDHAKSTIPELDVTTDDIESTWIISWAKGDGKSVQMCKSLSSEGAVPLSAVAVPCTESNVLTLLDLKNVPCGFYEEGHVFCFLPLPLKTKLQLHINGCFSVTSDRRQLASLTEDDKDSRGNTWNVALMGDSLVKAFLHLIQTLANSKMKVNSRYNYYDLWPAMCAQIVLPFQESFYKAIIEKNVKVFKGCQTWVSFQNAIFLDPNIYGSDVGGVAFEILSHFPPRQGKTLIEMPKQVIENIKLCNRGRENYILSAQVCEREFFLTFLKTLFSEFWNNRLDERNNLILAALKCRSDEVKKEMKNIKCIPSEPKNVLAKASDLIHPGSTVASLFSDSEEIFPLSTKEFRKVSTLAKLVDLGMNATYLPSALLINRCESVSALAGNCGICANERFVNLMRYLSHDTVLRELEKDKLTVGEVTEQFMFPILSKPTGWNFSWKADSDSTHIKIYSGNHSCKKHKSAKGQFAFGKSKNLYRQSTADYAGIVGYVVDESYTFPLKENRKSSEKVLELFGIKGLQEIPMEILTQQLKLLSEQYKDKKEQFEDVSRIHEKIFKHLEKKMKFSELDESAKQSIDILRHCRFVLIGDELLNAQDVAFNVKEEFKPQLYRLPEIDKLNKSTIYSYLGVEQYFNVEAIVKVLQSIMRPNEKVVNVETINNLLINLDEIMQNDGTPYEELTEFHELIIAPDTNCMLWPTYQLVVENEEYMTSLSMKILHPSITPAVAKRLGSKVKKLRCYQEISVGVSFGQREELVTRIKGLLKAYPCDSSIMKELLQNADDAGATEIHFVKDYRNHSTEKLFKSSCGVLQGPSLCVYNNSFFTKKDIEGIHNLGQGSKSDDPTKTGQYGVGFNAVYHLTDTPSFVTKGPNDADEGLMFILDPLCKHVPQATTDEPGVMCTLADLETNFSDHMLGFSIRELIKGDIGTVFRLPLRKTSSDISEEEIDIPKLDEILHSFEADMFESVLFLKNISSIKISDITSGELIEEYSVQVHLSQEAANKRTIFKEEVDKINKENIKCREKNLDIEAKEVIYEMNVKDTRNNSKHWVIIQRFGINGTVDHLDEIREYLKSGDLGLLPSGGVAIQLNCNLVADITQGETQNPTNSSQSDPGVRSKTEAKRSMTLHGRAFCFLPLPIFTGLPVHVNGHFALDHEARRDLWKDGYRMRWNTCILNAVIIPAWVSGLLHLCNYITPALQNVKIWQTVNAVLADYHSFFPTENCTSNTWNDVSNHFYTYVLREKVALFPCVLDNRCEIRTASSVCSTSRGRFCILWTPVSATAETEFYGVFKTVHDEIRKQYDVMSTQKAVSSIIQLLKAFGMKLLETPSKVRAAMVKAGHENVPTSSPHFVKSFLKTFADHSDSSCDVGPVGRHISETKYITPNNLDVLLDYILQDKDCYKNLTGIPILLTADGILRVCSKDSPVFISKYSKLLPNSAQLFVHDEIQFSLRDPKLFQTEIFKMFEFGDFVRLLPSTMDVNVFSKGSNIKLKEKANDEDEISPTISQEWLTLLYDFLYENSMQTSHQEVMQPKTVFDSPQPERKIDSEMLEENIKLLDTWSFLPCIGNDNTHVLIPMKETFHLLFLSAVDKLEKTGKSLAKFCLPKLYVNAFSKCSAKKDVQKSMENTVASLNRPYDLLRCLVHHRDTLKSSDRNTEDDGIELLSYFGRHLNVLKKFVDKDALVSLLRQVPLYLTQQGTMTDLATTQEVLVLPKGMPFGGIQTWADTSNVILLQEKESLESLFEFLGLQKADEDYVYGQKILPTFNAIPDQHWMEHIEYLRDKLGHRVVLSPNQIKVIHELKVIAFIDVNGVKKRANQLYDQSNITFKYLVNSNECLPSGMQSSEWRQFLKKLGLKCDVTDEMMIMFARQIELESVNNSMECVHQKSKILLRRFVEVDGEDWKITTLSQIRTIKFIKPCVIDDECKNVCAQSASRCICFYDSVSSDNSDLCWTSVNLLPSKHYQKLSKTVRKQLGIQDKPPLDKVVLHFHNVCDSLRIKLTDGTVSDSFVKKQMSCFYEFFSNCPSLSDQSITKLRGEPFLHLPEEKDIVLVSKVVVDLPSALEIKPYFYKAPTYYGKYYELFQKIGSKKTIMFCHYASVLQRIKDECKDEEMSVPERAVVRRAFRGLVKLAPDEDTSTEELQSVFLPTQKMFLKDSKQVIVSNKLPFEIRLKGNIELDLCAGESFIDFKHISLEEVIAKWPGHLKPLLLTDVIKEEVCIEAALNQRIRNSRKASKIETFLHSHELVTGLCRLIKHQSTKEASKHQFNAERTETEIANNLQNVLVVEFPALKTVLKYQGRIVSGSEREINDYIQNENGNMSHPMTFYFNDESKTERIYIPRILHGIIRLLTICASGLNAESIVHVTLLIQSLETPHKIHEILDHLHIKPYGSPQTTSHDYFPKPGTYVEPQFIPFLEQGISPFKDFEFDHVAMELEDTSLEKDDDGGQNPVFIYVKILHELVDPDDTGTNDLRRMYIVETGNYDIPTEKVPIYRLYRFIRKETCLSKDLEVYTGKQSEQQLPPLDDQCKKIREELKQAWNLPEEDRKRVLRRILLRWHPDKNRGNEEYCTKVFQYIQIILSRLENDERLDDDVEEEMKRGKSQFSQSSSTFYENVFRRARSYARAYYDNFDAYNRSERTGDYAHSTSTHMKRQDHGETQRWFRQAKIDYLAASEMYPTASGTSSFNWVCYICHQACEKALKAAHYSRDANKVPEGIFLPTLAITPEMVQQATLLENRLGAHGRLRYPDALSRPRIPSDMFSKEDAEFALLIAKTILELVEEYI